MASRLRWVVLSIFVISTALNYLDRLLLAALAPTLKSEFHLSNTQYGGVISVFSIVYAVMAPVAGWFIDRVGLNTGITVSMAVWSVAGMATGLTRSFGGLLASRTVLGIGEAAGIPCAGKANGVYLQPRELAFGTALNQVGITMGSIAAPLMVAVMAPRVWVAQRVRGVRGAGIPVDSGVVGHGEEITRAEDGSRRRRRAASPKFCATGASGDSPPRTRW